MEGYLLKIGSRYRRGPVPYGAIVFNQDPDSSNNSGGGPPKSEPINLSPLELTATADKASIPDSVELNIREALEKSIPGLGEFF